MPCGESARSAGRVSTHALLLLLAERASISGLCIWVHGRLIYIATRRAAGLSTRLSIRLGTQRLVSALLLASSAEPAIVLSLSETALRAAVLRNIVLREIVLRKIVLRNARRSHVRLLLRHRGTVAPLLLLRLRLLDLPQLRLIQRLAGILLQQHLALIKGHGCRRRRRARDHAAIRNACWRRIPRRIPSAQNCAPLRSDRRPHSDFGLHGDTGRNHDG